VCNNFLAGSYIFREIVETGIIIVGAGAMTIGRKLYIGY